MVTTLDEMPRLLTIPSAGVTQFEWPKKIIRLLEMWSHSDYLMDEVLHADYSEFPEGFFDDCVVGEGYSLLSDLAVAALVDEVSRRFDSRVPGVVCVVCVVCVCVCVCVRACVCACEVL